MLIQARQIDATLKTPLAEGRRGMLIYGPDQGLVQMRIEAVCEWFRKDGWEVKSISREQLKEQPSFILDELNNLSFFAQKQVFVLRPAMDGNTKMLQEAWPLISAESYVLCWGEELPKSSSLRGFFEKEAQAACIPCYEPDAQQTAELIRTALAQKGKQIQPDALRYFAEQLGGELMVLGQEVEKLAVYLGSHTNATVQDVAAVIAANGEEAFSDFAHALLDGKAAEALMSLEDLLQEGQSAVGLVRMLARFFERLLALRLRMDEEGKTAAQVVQEAKPPIFFKEAPVYQRALARWSAAALLEALRKTSDTERAIKTTGSHIESVMLGYTRTLLRAPQRLPASLRSSPSSSARLS